MPSSSLPAIIGRRAPLCVIAALCLMAGTAQAAGSNTTSAAAMHGLKAQLTRLRDVTVGGITPAYAANKNAEYAGSLRSAEGRLFKPLRAEAHAGVLGLPAHPSATLSKAQSMGVQISDRTQLHCDFTRYRTADDQREISLKLGINIGFR